MSDCKLDHLVVAAADLNAGREHIEALLGVETEAGGRHDAMGTHNRLLRLGDDQYLEIIAVDPDSKRPKRPRWFALDESATQSRIRNTPALITWVARSAAIGESAARAPYNNLEIHDMARDDLRWRMTFTRDGGLLYDGVLPLLIEWQTEPAPPRLLPDTGCTLSRFVVQSPHAREVEQVLQDLNIGGVSVDHSLQAGLAAILNTPERGEVVLSSAMESG